ncbi:MAG: two-component system response regulator [Betaproteobacteria bacterium]
MAETIFNQRDAQSGDKKKRLLIVVDGDGAYLYYTGILLQHLDYTIYTTKTAEEALEVMNISLPSLVLTEVNLPRMNGMEFLKQLKQNPTTKSIPVVVYSLSKDPAVRDACLRGGAAAFLAKPVDPDALYAAIQKSTEATPRSYIRLNTCLKVIIGDETEAETASIEDCVTALSENGMYVSTTRTRPTGARVPITLSLGSATIRIEGMVLYSFDRSRGPLRTPGMGIKFVRIGPREQALIKAFIEKQITSGLPQTPHAGQ